MESADSTNRPRTAAVPSRSNVARPASFRVPMTSRIGKASGGAERVRNWIACAARTGQREPR